MDIIHHFGQVHVAGRTFAGSEREQRVLGMILRVAMTQNAIVLEKQLHFLRTQVESKNDGEMLRASNQFLLHCLVEQSL